MQGFFEYLDKLDSSLLLAINGCHNPAFDAVMMFLTNRWVWIAVAPVLVFFVFRSGGWKRGIVCVVCVALAIAFSDQICAHVIRPVVCRLRPSNIENPLSQYVHIVNGYRSGSYGFPSCHGSTTMAIAIFLSLYFRRTWATVLLLGWSFLMCYTRIYLGVHYPGDILVGMAIGALAAWGAFMLYRYVTTRLRPGSGNPQQTPHRVPEDENKPLPD